MEWTQEKTLEFIALFKQKPCLWHPRYHTHTNRPERNDAWQKLLKNISFDATLEELKHKKESLQGYYRTHVKKIIAKKKKNEVHATDWFAFDALDSFLRPVYTGKKVKHGSRLWVNNGDGSNSVDSTSSVPVIYNAATGFIPANQNQQTEEPPEEPSRLTEYTNNPSNNKTDPSNDDKALIDDEFQIYGSYVASQLSLLSVEQSLLARHKIQSILTQSRLQDLKDAKDKYCQNKTVTTIRSDSNAEIDSVQYVLCVDEIKSEANGDECYEITL